MLSKGPNVTLRRLSKGDLAVFQAYRNDPDVARYQSWQPMSDEQAIGFLSAVATEPLLQPGQWSQIGIADRPTGTLLGDIGVHVAQDLSAAEIGITLARASQRAGRATEALGLAITLVLETLPVRKIWLITDDRNQRSIALIRRVGATYSHSETAAGVTEQFHFLDRPPG